MESLKFSFGTGDAYSRSTPDVTTITQGLQDDTKRRNPYVQMESCHYRNDSGMRERFSPRSALPCNHDINTKRRKFQVKEKAVTADTIPAFASGSFSPRSPSLPCNHDIKTADRALD